MGLGAHLYEYFKGRYTVIGIAKRHFAENRAVKAVIRGDSRKPVWVTSEGIEPIVAAEIVMNMAGKHRIPSLMRRVDQLSRTGIGQKNP